jgi:hypothetical protein
LSKIAIAAGFPSKMADFSTDPLVEENLSGISPLEGSVQWKLSRFIIDFALSRVGNPKRILFTVYSASPSQIPFN